MRKRIVVALGGNALGTNLEEQMTCVKIAAVSIVDLLEEGYKVVVSHGNGPQVGFIRDCFDFYEKSHNTKTLPMSVCVSLSQGYIGYDLQNALEEEILNRGLSVPVCTIITQVVVDENDPAFNNPTKPIGSYLSKDEADKLTASGEKVTEIKGKGFRKIVPSPKPLQIVESEAIKTLCKNNQLVIACGGGGIPVIKQGNHLKGVEAVIDKDFASGKLAELIHADYFVILTAIEKVFINFGTENEKALDTLTVKEAVNYADSGEFGKGSMEPKVRACADFVVKTDEGEALITQLERVRDGLQGKTGTRIIK